MKIAVSSQNFRTVTNHAGRARRFLVFSADKDQRPIEIERIDLPKEMSLHEMRNSDAAHPLDTVDVILSASFGAGFARKMESRNVIPSLTDKSDPLEAVLEFLEKGQQMPELCGCGHDHAKGHGDGHGHGHDDEGHHH